MTTEAAQLLTAEPSLAPARGRPRAHTNLMRLGAYLRPHWATFAAMAAFDAANVAAALVIPILTRRAIDGPIAAHDIGGVWAYGLAALGIGIAAVVLMFLRRWWASAMTLDVENQIRLEMYARLQRLPMSFHGRWQSGQLLSRMMGDLSTVRRFLSFGLLMLVMNVIQLIVSLILLIAMYAPLGAIVAAAALPLVAMCTFVERRWVVISRRIKDQVGDIASTVEESTHGLRTIKSFGRQEWAYAKFDARAKAVYETQLGGIRLLTRFFTALDVLPSLVVVIVLAVGVRAAASGELSPGTLVAFLTLLMSLVWPIVMLGFLLSQLQEAMASADRIAEVLDAPIDLASGPVRLPDCRGELEFDNVSFRFPGAERDVLRGVSLRTRPGETIALVGGTGSGKTTLTGLVPRLADVTGGRILLDGHDLRELDLGDLRRHVATAFEEPTLFSMSARENLTLGRADATDTEIAEAIDVAQAGFVHDLPHGLDTRIGEQGMSLSGGQRQRLALARAVLTKPAVLVLDDTLSALDIHTEALVEKALARVLATATAIVVAHRASTVMLADRVVMLIDGEVAAIGTHSELLATDPRYRELLAADFDLEREGTR